MRDIEIEREREREEREKREKGEGERSVVKYLFVVGPTVSDDNLNSFVGRSYALAAIPVLDGWHRRLFQSSSMWPYDVDVFKQVVFVAGNRIMQE